MKSYERWHLATRSLAGARQAWAERRFASGVAGLSEAVLQGVSLLRALPAPPGPVPQQVRLLQDLQCLRELTGDAREAPARETLFRDCARRAEGLLRRLGSVARPALSP